MGLNTVTRTGIDFRHKIILVVMIAAIIFVVFVFVLSSLFLKSELKDAADQFLGKTVVLDGQCYTITDHSQDCRSWALSNGATISWDLLKTLPRYESCPKESRD